MIIRESHTVNGLDENIRFIDYLIGRMDGLATRNSVKKAIRRNELLLNGKPAETGIWLQNGDTIEWIDIQSGIPRAYNLPIEIVYEDEWMAVVNKPPGLVVSGNRFKTLENCLVDQLSVSSQSDALKWGKPVHRLDAPTSGLVVFAKASEAHRRLGQMFEEKQIHKTYYAIVQGKPDDQVINDPIDGKAAVSILEVVRTVPSLKNNALSLVRLHPETGRTHQLRIHCKGIGHPIVGDKLYGEDGNIMKHKGLFLASTGLKLKHPVSGENLEITIDLPQKFNALLDREERTWEKNR